MKYSPSSPPAIELLSFVICHLSFVICHLSFVICHWSLVICHYSPVPSPQRCTELVEVSPIPNSQSPAMH
ncbi:MAG: hypothetical protein HEQ19_25900 [Gloeotrichia echinulata CP02]